MDFLFLKKLWNCVGGRVQQKFGFIKRVDEGWITTVKGLESWSFERYQWAVPYSLVVAQPIKRSIKKWSNGWILLNSIKEEFKWMSKN